MQKSGKTSRREEKIKLCQFSSRPRKRIFGGQLILLFTPTCNKEGVLKERCFFWLRDVSFLFCPKKEKNSSIKSFEKTRKRLQREKKRSHKSSCGFSNSLSSGRDRRVPSARPLLLFLLGILRTTEDEMEKELLAFLGVLKRSRRRN